MICIRKMEVKQLNFSISLGQNSKDWIDYFSAISPFLIGLFTLGFYFWNAKTQKRQWLNDVLIKNEYKVLLHMKNLISKNLIALQWYFNYVLSEYIFEEEEILKQKDFIHQMHFYHPKILELYNYYRENYYIFEKYNLLKELKIIHFMMHMSKVMDEDRYVGVNIKKTSKESLECWKYDFSEYVQSSLEEWIAENRQDLINAKNNCKNNCKDHCSNCSNREVAFDIMHKEIYWLIHKFDKLTLSNAPKDFDLYKEIDKLWRFEPYTNLKNKEMSAKEKKEQKAFKEKLLKEFEGEVNLRQESPENAI